VTKGGFYGHFADRNALLAEMQVAQKKLNAQLTRAW
jgi:hypothetical protein